MPARDDFFRAQVAAMQGYVPGEQPRRQDLIKLNTNENPYPPSPAVAAVLRELDAASLNRYPDPLAADVRRAAAAVMGGAPEQVLVGNGSDDILTIATRSFADQGGAAAFLSPSYSLYPILAQIQGCRTIPVALQDDFSWPTDLLAEAAGASLLLIARPNAPTGNAAPMADVEDVCAGFDGVVLIDEAYADFADSHCADLVARHPNVVIARTLSKGYSLAGIRLGFAYANAALISGMMKVKDSYNVNCMTQRLAAAALDDQDHLRANTARIQLTRAHLAEALGELGFTVCPSQANFLFVRPPLPGADYLAQLRNNDILVRHFAGPVTGDYVRITIGTDPEIDRLIGVSREIVAAL